MPRRPTLFPLLFLLPIAAAALGCGGTSAEQRAAESPDSPPGLTAKGVLAEMVATYRNADSYFDNAEYHESFMRQGEDLLIKPPSHLVSVVLQRPNQVRITRSVPQDAGPALDVAVGSDGRRLTATISDLPAQLLDMPAPEVLTPQAIAPDPRLRTALLPVPLPNLYPQLDLLLATDDNPPVLLADAEAKLLPSGTLADAECHRVELIRTDGVFVLWIDASTRLLRRMEVPTAALRRELDPEGVMLDWRLWIEFNDATIGGPLADSVFQVPPLENAEKVTSFKPSN